MGLYLQTSIVFLYAILLGIYIITRLRYKKKKFRIFSIKRYFRYIKLVLKINIILTIIISSFISNSIIRYQNKKYDNLFNNIEEIKATAIVISNKEEKEYSNRYKIKVCEGEFKQAYLYITISKEQELEYGDKIQVKGDFIEPQKARNYKGFDYKKYLKTLKIYGTIKAEKVIIKEKNCGNKLMLISNKAFFKIKNNIEETYNKTTSGIILGIMLGNTENIDEDIKEDFSQSSISHVLAVSGMHVSYIIFLVTTSTKKILGKRKSKIITSIVLLVYMFITGFSVSVVRASIMGILLCMSFIVYRKSDTLNNIAISALIILLNNPFIIISTSFLLSFGGTIGIIYFKPTVEKIIKGVKIRNRKYKYVFLKIQRKCDKIIEIISVSISAQITIVPIMILKFNTLGISFLITNLLLSFVIGLIVMGGFIQIIISFISIKFGMTIAKILQIPIYILIFISKLGTKIPFGNFKVITPDLYQVVLYYLVIFLFKELFNVFNNKHPSTSQSRVRNTIFLIKYKLKPNKNKIKYIILSLIIVCFFISKIPDDLKIYFIDVGQGDSTLIVTPTKKTILIDGGGSSNYDMGENVLVPYLLDRKFQKINYIIVSHFDQDHVRTDF